MMQDDINEFVFKRKRKRLQIDVQVTETVITNNEPHPGLIPAITVLSMASSPAAPIPPSPGPEVLSESVISVERFLRSVQTVPRRKPRAYNRHRATKRRTAPVRKTAKPKRPRESPQIARTLFRAAVLADGDPLDTLANGAGISLTRRPLKFVPFDTFAGPFKSDKIRDVEPSELDRGEHVVLHARPLRRVKDPPSGSHTRTPLCLVPLHEAEAAYSHIFPSRHALLKL